MVTWILYLLHQMTMPLPGTKMTEQQTLPGQQQILPPAPMPPPMPLPVNPGLAPLPAPLSPPGLPLPLDAPLPAAPEVAVAGSPVEETLSKDEQNELLSELS